MKKNCHNVTIFFYPSFIFFWLIFSIICHFIQKKCSIIEQSVMSFRKKFCHKVFGGFIVSLWQKLMQKLSLVC